MPKYHITIGGKNYVVDSAQPLSDDDAYAYAAQQHGIDAPVPSHDRSTPANPMTPLSDREPGTWWGGFTKGLLGDEALMTTAGITAAGALAPVTGGASALTIPALMAAGGAAGATGANLVRRATDSRPQDDLVDEAGSGALEGAFSGAAGPAMKALGKGLGYAGEALGPMARRIGSWGMGGPMGAGVAEAALNPKLAPAALEAVGDMASVPTIRRAFGNATEELMGRLHPEAPVPSHASTLNRAYGIRPGTEIPYRAPSGVSGPFSEVTESTLASQPRVATGVDRLGHNLLRDVPETPSSTTALREMLESVRQPRAADPMFSDVRGLLEERALRDVLKGSRYTPNQFGHSAADMLDAPSMRALRQAVGPAQR